MVYLMRPNHAGQTVNERKKMWHWY